MTKQMVLEYLEADCSRRILVVSFKGVECYNAPAPIGVGQLYGSVIEEMEDEGLLVRKGDSFMLA